MGIHQGLKERHDGVAAVASNPGPAVYDDHRGKGPMTIGDARIQAQSSAACLPVFDILTQFCLCMQNKRKRNKKSYQVTAGHLEKTYEIRAGFRHF